MDNGNKKKYEQLGMPFGTAMGRLRKALMFKFASELGKDICFQCGEPIENVDQLSVEHKIPWLDSQDPTAMFFDLENVAFSHLHCNIGAARPNRWNKGNMSPHGTSSRYDTHNCRCDLCKEAKSIRNKKRIRVYI